MGDVTAIDPGVQQGWARFSGGCMYACGLGEPPALIGEVVIELPEYRPSQRDRRVDPNDLITLAVRVGKLAARAEARGLVVELVRPTRWKGSVPKRIHHQRIGRALTVEEHAVLNGVRVADSLRHNVLDAIGIGLWKIGRL